MESRTLLAVILSLLVLVGFQYFLGPQTAPTPDGLNATENQFDTEKEKNQPKQDTLSTQEDASARKTQPLSPPLLPVKDAHLRDIVVDTDLYKIVFTEQGAGVKEYLLKEYGTELSPEAPRVNLVNVIPPHLPLVLGIGKQQVLELSTQPFVADQPEVHVGPEKQEATLTFSTRLQNGITITETYTFHHNSYWIDCLITAQGPKDQPISIFLYNRPQAKANRYIFSGASYYAQGKLEEVTLDDVGEIHKYSGPLDWMGYGDNYFFGALIPADNAKTWDISIKKLDSTGLTASQLSQGNFAGGQSNVLKVGIYFGPKEIDRLKELGHNLSKAINFGWFDPIAKPLLYILKFLSKYLPNYGVAIILITVLIKIAFWPLAHKSAKSMKTMQKLQPKLAKLKEKYGDDKERLNKELLQLYKTYRVNPMSGCLPMLLQIPVFFALYKVLLQAIELRHAPFMLWINDLSAPDRLMIPGVTIPYLGGIPVLTLLMGLSMYLQQKMSPSSLDPTQAKMMQFLPVIFTFMFINFPSGLVLYWLVNNILSIVQQYYVNKFTD